MTSIEPIIKLLLADDDTNFLKAMQFVASSRNWEVHCVESAQGIIDAINNACVDGGQCFDAIVTDVNFYDNSPGPRITGITAIRQIRKAHEDLPVIFVSGWVNNILREEARRVSAEMLSKPVDLDDLFDRIESQVIWHRLANSAGYEGPERRKNSVNKTEYRRRKYDDMAKVETPDILKQIMSEVRDENNKLNAGIG